MRFIGKCSNKSSNYLYFFEEPASSIENVKSEDDILKVLAEASLTPLEVTGNTVTGCKFAAVGGGHYLHVGMAPSVEGDFVLGSLVPSYPESTKYRNGRSHMISTMQTDPARPYRIDRQPYGTVTIEDCTDNSMFLVRGNLRSSYEVLAPSSSTVTMQAGGHGSSYNTKYRYAFKAFVKKYKKAEQASVTEDKYFELRRIQGGWGQADYSQKASFTAQPQIVMDSDTHLIVLTDIGYRSSHTGSSETLATYTEGSLPRVGKSIPKASGLLEITEGLLVFYNGRRRMYEYAKYTKDSDFSCSEPIIDGENVVVEINQAAQMNLILQREVLV